MIHEQFTEAEMLRMTKNELIQHIFSCYKDMHKSFEALSEWWAIIERMKQNERFKEIYDNVGD